MGDVGEEGQRGLRVEGGARVSGGAEQVDDVDDILADYWRKVLYRFSFFNTL